MIRRLKRSHDRICKCGSPRKTVFVQTWVWTRQARAIGSISAPEPDSWPAMIARAMDEIQIAAE